MCLGLWSTVLMEDHLLGSSSTGLTHTSWVDAINKQSRKLFDTQFLSSRICPLMFFPLLFQWRMCPLALAGKGRAVAALGQKDPCERWQKPEQCVHKKDDPLKCEDIIRNSCGCSSFMHMNFHKDIWRRAPWMSNTDKDTHAGVKSMWGSVWGLDLKAGCSGCSAVH